MSDPTDPGPDRRRFLCQLAGSGCAVLLAQCTFSEVYTEAGSASLPFDVADPTYAALAEIGGTLGIDVTTDADPAKVLLIRRTAEQIVALERICPHTLCDMDPAGGLGVWDQAEDQLVCLCHLSTFAPDGRKLSGPSPRSIAAYAVSFDATTGTGTLTIGEPAAGDGGVDG
ncbi:MAG: Rieske (2Fe-2S) protein [bacterium]